VTIAPALRTKPREVAPIVRGLSNAIWSFPLYLLFAVLIGLPLGTVLSQAVLPHLFDVTNPSFQVDIEPVRRTLASVRTATAIVNSLELAAVVSVTATLVGTGLAVLFGRFDFPFKAVLRPLPWIVFLTPSYLKALAWLLLMSPGGYLVQMGILPGAAASAFFGIGGLIFVHTISLFPVPAFIVGAALVGIGREYEDAGRLAGAPLWKVWLRINGPLLFPALALSLMAVFAEVLSDFGVASTIARTSNFGVLTYGIYVAASSYPVDFSLAGGQALVLLLLVALVVAADRLLRRRTAPKLISGRSRPAIPTPLGNWRWPASAAIMLLATLALLLPLSAIVVRAGTRTLSAGVSPGNFTFSNLAQALTFGTPASGAILRSLAFALVTAVIASVLSLLLAARLERVSPAAKASVTALCLGSVAIPGIILGFGYILVWNRIPFFAGWNIPRYGDASLLVTGYVAAALPYCLIVIMSAVEQLSPNLVDAARLHGIPPWRRMLRVVLPLVVTSIVTAFLLAFVRTVFELPMSQMLIPLKGPAAPTVILNLFSHERDGPAAAIALATMLATGITAGAGWLLYRWAVGLRGSIQPGALI
jgi:iron(III) transport system permease protein